MLFLPAKYIQTSKELQQLVDNLANDALIAVDTESNSLHAYQERVCLIQLSTRTADYIVDPIAISDLRPFGELMHNASIRKIFHAAEYDIMTMKRDFGFEFRNVFDTMMAARVCGFPSIGLGSLLEEYAGIHLDKRHQKDNWGKRPLPADSLRYAQMDTHYLPLLYDEFVEELKRVNRFIEAEEAFSELCDLPPAEKKQFDPDDFWNLGTPNRLRKDEMPILKELYTAREQIAMERDVPPFKVISNKVLIRLARTTPSQFDELEQVGLTYWQAKRHGKRLLAAIEYGKQSEPLAPPPPPKRPDPIISERYAALHAWRRERAISRGVESDIIVSKNTLWDVAYKGPSSLEELRIVQGMGPWRLKNYGEEILNILDGIKQLS